MAIELRDMATWPAGLYFDKAAAYSGLSASVILSSASDGDLVLKPIGPHGRKIVLREQLDAYIKKLFASIGSALLEDMDSG